MKAKKWTKKEDPKKMDIEEEEEEYDPWDEEQIQKLRETKHIKTKEEWMREAEFFINTTTRKQRDTMTPEEIMNYKIETIDKWVRAGRIDPDQGNQLKMKITNTKYKSNVKYPGKTFAQMVNEESSENYELRNKDLTARVINFGKQSQSTINPNTMEITKNFYKQTVKNMKNWIEKKEEPKKGHKKSQSRNVLLNQFIEKAKTQLKKDESPKSTKSARSGVTTRGMAKKELEELIKKEKENKEIFQSNKKKKKEKKNKEGNFTEEVEDILERRYSDPIKNFTQTTTFYDKAKKYFDKAKSVISTVDTAAKIYAYGTMAATALYHGYNMINLRRYNRNNNLPGAPAPI